MLRSSLAPDTFPFSNSKGRLREQRYCRDVSCEEKELPGRHIPSTQAWPVGMPVSASTVEPRGKMWGLMLSSLVLLQAFSVPGGTAESPQSDRTWCHGSGACYSVHLGSLNFHRAQNACAAYGGGLSTASDKAEVQAILTLLRGVANGPGVSMFWLGLVRKAQQCTIEELPLRGFTWAPAGLLEAKAVNETAEQTLSWVREPSKSCTKPKCAGLQVTFGAPLLESWGLIELACTKANSGYICKYNYAGACPALHPPGARSLQYTLPFRVQSAAVEFSPPGTVLTLRCPGREARFTCRPSPDGYHWEGTEHGLCSCPSGYWNPSKGACVEPADCLGAHSTFLCLCAWGSGLAASEKSCLPPAQTGAALTTAALPTTPAFLSSSTSGSLPGQNNSLQEAFPSEVDNSSFPGAEKPLIYADSSNYVFILITVAVVMLVILVMVALQAFQVCSKCFKGCQSNKDGAPAAALEGDPEASATCTNSEHSLGPSKAESAEASRDDPKPLDSWN
ncbi:C-type lectin domain family 14 member A [Rhineura floridana]|uniref:C-type lectin domain family 14 member A n=1 Tax=Rhineura floridana TaxID=261503 RepID=UPI002AC89006|nr:C-type lectin domain family 14 member A [Rhineura floridana]